MSKQISVKDMDPDEFLDARDRKWEDDAKATGLEPIPQPDYDDVSMEACLYRALHMFSHGTERWTIARKKGLTDVELKAMIGEEFGISGGGNGHRENGGANPGFWWEASPDGTDYKKPTLQGKALIDAVRRLMQIPMPGQRELF